MQVFTQREERKQRENKLYMRKKLMGEDSLEDIILIKLLVFTP